jgi:thiamine-phosphate pyrophosphorylase
MVGIPLVAIGGIHVSNVREVMRAGANGLAVVSAIVAADCPGSAAAAIRHEIDDAMHGGVTGTSFRT